MKPKFRRYTFVVPMAVDPAVREWLRLGKLLTGSPKPSQTLLMTIAEVISGWIERAEKGERG